MAKTLKLAFLDVTRKKGRTIVSIIGIVIAITLIAGSNIFIDSIVEAGLRAKLNEISVEFLGESRSLNDDYINISKRLSEVNHVEHVEPVCKLGTVDVIAEDNKSISYFDLFGVMPNIEKYIHRYGWDGRVVFTRYNVVLLDKDAKLLKVNVGDKIKLRHTIYNQTTHNITELSLSVEISSILRVNPEYPGWEDPFFGSLVLVNLSEKEYFIKKLNLTSGGGKPPPSEPPEIPPGGGGGVYTPSDEKGFTYLIWVERSIIDSTDIDTTKKTLTRFKRNLESAVTFYNVAIRMNSQLSSVLEYYDRELVVYRVIFMALTLPLVVLGIYLAIVCIDLTMSERRRDIGILKSRGASNHHVFSMLLIESFILGIIAGILGIIAGIFTSKLLMVYMAPSIFETAGMKIDLLETDISLTSVIVSVVFAVIFMLIAAYRPAKRTANLSVSESMHQYTTEEAKIPYKYTWDLIFLGLAIFTYAGMVYIRPLREGGFEGGGIFLGMLLPILTVLIPLSPFFLIFSVTRLLTRTTTKIYDYCSRLTKFFTKDLWSIVNKNVVRNPRRVSNVCVIIAIGVALGILISTIYGTEIASTEREAKAIVGSDISVSTFTSREFKSNLTSIPGVETVTPISYGTTYSMETEGGYIAKGSPAMSILDTESYIKVVDMEDYYFEKGDKKKLADLSKPGNVVVNKGFADQNYYEVGDTITIPFEYTDINGTTHREPQQFRIICIVKVLPGASTQWGDVIYIDYKYVNPKYVINSTTTFLIKVSKDYEPGKVRDAITERYPILVDYVVVFDEELEKEQSDAKPFINFMLMEYVLIILVVALGLSIIIYVASVQRENELASIVSRGASTSQVCSLLMGESVTIIIIGVTIGCGTGFITAYVFNELFFGGTITAFGRPLTIPMLTHILLGIVVLALLVGSFIATIRIRKMNLVRVLKRRGG